MNLFHRENHHGPRLRTVYHIKRYTPAMAEFIAKIEGEAGYYYAEKNTFGTRNGARLHQYWLVSFGENGFHLWYVIYIPTDDVNEAKEIIEYSNNFEYVINNLVCTDEIDEYYEKMSQSEYF